MPSNFAELGKHLQTAIPVPELPLGSIHNRLRDANARQHSSVSIACALAAITVLGSGTVLASMMFGGVRIWLSGDKAALTMHSFVYVQNPNADDLRRVTTDATFPVVLPIGIPKGMHMNELFFSPADHPNFIEVSYRNAKTDARSGQFLLFDSSTVNDGEASIPNGEEMQVGQVAHWNIGQETVVVPGQQAGMKAAMSGITPAESLAQTLPMLYRIIVLAEQDRLADAAEVIAPSEGRSVLIDREFLGHIKITAQSYKKRVMFVRATMFDNLPFVAGKPDFANQRSHFITEIAVSAGGVRAIGAVLRSIGTVDCGCEILFDQPNGTTYWVWTIPMTSSGSVRKYAVDAKTLAVAPQAKTR